MSPLHERNQIKHPTHELFKKLGILPLQSQYILSLALFVIKNMKIFTPNSDIHTKNTRNKSIMCHRQDWPNIKKVYILLALKFSITYPKTLKLSSDTNKFKRELKKFLLLGSFYSIEEFFGWTSLRNLYALHL